MKGKKQRGGRRKGAGRPTTDPSGAKRPITVWLAPAEREHCEQLGESAARGIRRLICASMSPTNVSA